MSNLVTGISGADPSPRLRALAQVPLFGGLNRQELEELAAVARERSYRAGEDLFLEGAPCAGMYVLVRGVVQIVKASPAGREIMLAVESAPSTVAEIPLFDGDPYPATVRAVKDSVTLLILKEDFQALCRRHPDLLLKILAVVGRRLRRLVSVVEDVTFGSVRQRLARVLLEFSDEASGADFLLPATHEELAARLGTVREVISRNLGRFQAEGLIRVERREISLLNRQGLESEAETEL